MSEKLYHRLLLAVILVGIVATAILIGYTV